MRDRSVACRQEAGAVQSIPSDLPSFNKAKRARQSAARNGISQTIRRMKKRRGFIWRAKQGIGGDGVRLTLVKIHSLVATKIAINLSKLDIVKSMTFEIVRLRFHKVTLF
jgi:hypothetical protein